MKQKHNYKLLICALFVSSCIYKTTTWTPLKNYTTPGLVALVTKINGSIYLPKCSGVLIDNSIVLTAAHCVDSNKEIQKSGVVYGCYHIYDSDCKIANTLITNRTENYDVAMLLVDKDLSTNIEIVNLINHNLIEGQFVLVSGYGTKGYAKTGLSKIYINSPYDFLTDYRYKSRPEYGDSGGPAYVINNENLYLAGITNSFTTITYEEGDYFEGVKHASIYGHLTWINKNIKIMQTLKTMFSK